MSTEQIFIKDVPKDIYRKLQQHLDQLPIGYPPTESGNDIKILKFIFTPEEAYWARVDPSPKLSSSGWAPNNTSFLSVFILNPISIL